MPQEAAILNRLLPENVFLARLDLSDKILNFELVL